MTLYEKSEYYPRGGSISKAQGTSSGIHSAITTFAPVSREYLRVSSYVKNVASCIFFTV